MSDPTRDTGEEDIDLAAPETRAAGRWHSAGVPTEKSKDFGAAVRRLSRLLGREWRTVTAIAVLAVSSTVCNVLGPRVLGRGTDVIVRGVVGEYQGAYACGREVIPGGRTQPARSDHRDARGLEPALPCLADFRQA